MTGTRPASVSVCMATFNGETYVAEQLRSILQQLGRDDEVIVVDDGSSDGTLGAIAALADDRIRVFTNERNLGPIRTFERALASTRNELIFFSDQDDVWVPGKVEAFRREFEAGAQCIVSNATFTTADLTPLHGYFETYAARGGVVKNFVKNSYLGCCMAMTRRAKDWVLPFPRLILQHDEWVGMSCEIVSGVRFLPKALTLYRRHGSTVTTQKRFPLPKVMRNRVMYLTAILGRLPALLRHRRRLAALGSRG